MPVFFPLDTSYQDVTQQNVPPGFNMLRLPTEMEKEPVQISAGSVFSIGINGDGKVFIWGQASEKLRQIPGNLRRAVQVSAGLDHVLALDDTGRLFTWGNSRFSLGSIPPELLGVEIRQVLAGNQVSLVLTSDGRLTFWGNENLMTLRLQEVQGRVQKAALSSSACLALLEDGTVASLTTLETPVSAIPESIQGKVADITITDKAAAAVTVEGKVVTWGSNLQDVPEALQGKAVSIEAGRSHFTALASDGTVFSWGSNNFGQSDVPSSLEGEKVTAVYAGSYQNYAVTESGKVKTWGLKGYLMGTDGYGRDIFLNRYTYSRLTLTIGAIAVIISTFIGILVGGCLRVLWRKSGYGIDALSEIVRFYPIPAPCHDSFRHCREPGFGAGTDQHDYGDSGSTQLAGAFEIGPCPDSCGTGKGVRHSSPSCRCSGADHFIRHIIPNVITVIIVSATLDFAACLLTESSLSFLGFWCSGA